MGHASLSEMITYIRTKNPVGSLLPKLLFIKHTSDLPTVRDAIELLYVIEKRREEESDETHRP